MRAVVAAIILALVLATPVAARPASHPTCSVVLKSPTEFLITATRLASNTEYMTWWSVAYVDDGPPFYLAAQSAHPSDAKGNWGTIAPVQQRTGYWYFYIALPGQAYDPSAVLTFCEIVA